MRDYNVRTDESGFALVMTVLVVLIVGSLVAGATLIGANHLIVNSFYDRQSELEIAAEAGIELARSYLNADSDLYPADGYVTLQSNAQVTDGDGNVIPGVTRSLYAGPTGVTSGQYGVFGTILSVVEDDGGGRVIRRAQVYQESFSKYAYFTDVEPSNISFGGGDQLFGPVHSNSPIKIYSSGATFHGPVTTAEDVPDPDHGDFRQGYEEYVSEIEMPSTAELDKLENQAAQGNTSFDGDSNGGYGEATTRIEFRPVDMNGDGDFNDANEGFIKVYQSSDADWVTGRVDTSGGSCGWVWGPGWQWVCSSGGLESSEQCGAWYGDEFVTAAEHPHDGRDADDALLSGDRQCFLGGATEIADDNEFDASDDYGQWLAYPGTVDEDLEQALIDEGAPNGSEADYLFPINRAMNPNFKGVIYVDGKVVISGRLRGRVTVAASDDIIIGDDVTYITDPGAGTCVDILGIFAGDEVIVADNALNAPVDYGGNHRTFDDTSDEFIHGTVLALDIFTVHNYNSGSTNDEWCQGSSGGRGCLFLTGGIIQNTRGAVGTSSGSGYTKRYSYDQCGATQPPPYFPTTGYFAKGQRYRVDPGGFTVAGFFDLLTPDEP